MPSVTASIDVSASADIVYHYLRDRYNREAHRSTSLATKGYVPKVTCIEADSNNRLVFHVPGRDPWLRTSAGSWRWIYEVEPTGDSTSRVTISYHWSWLMAISGLGLIRHQACNEIVETAMALDAIGWSRLEPRAVPDRPCE
jgi:hypothetical protein